MRKDFLLPIIICSFALLTILFWQFIFLPIQSEILNMQIESRRLQAIEKSLLKLKARHENFAEFVELTDARLIEAENFLPDKPSQEKFTAEIYKIAAQNKIAVTNLQVGEINFVEDNKNLRRQSVKIKFEGNYISTINFLREIADGERFAKTENISIENLRDNFINCEVEFYIYSRVEN